MKALKLEKGQLHISRFLTSQSKPLALKRVVQYTPNWVKNQQRMASTSNQETFRADVDGRLVIDLLRHVRPHPLTPLSLLSFFEGVGLIAQDPLIACGLQLMRHVPGLWQTPGKLIPLQTEHLPMHASAVRAANEIHTQKLLRDSTLRGIVFFLGN